MGKKKLRKHKKRQIRPLPTGTVWVNDWSSLNCNNRQSSTFATLANSDLTAQTTPNAFQQMPNEILAEVFHCVNSSTHDDFKRVCARWYAILSTPPFATNVTLYALPDIRRCQHRVDMWDTCWRGHCTIERRTIRRRCALTKPSSLTFRAYPRDAAGRPPAPLYCRMPCDLWDWLPHTLTKVTMSSIHVRLASLVQLARTCREIVLANVEVAGITSMEERLMWGGRYELRWPDIEQSGVYRDFSYRLVVQRAVLPGDGFMESIWKLIERLVAGQMTEKTTYLQLIHDCIMENLQEADEDRRAPVDLFVQKVILSRNTDIPSTLLDHIDGNFPWITLTAATLLELATGLKSLLRKPFEPLYVVVG
ncbi:uncharacterized protein LOC129595591 isoform X2 [Paramacrobiotus metropolitanus]|nr:uncharacterized protein LOC129595591 isoform X2 [Paramacrobiotus metropolitanus]